MGNILAGLGAVAVLAVVVVAVVRRRHVEAPSDQMYCLSCGRPLADGEVCPDCGPDAGIFEKPKL
jgi:hypothetical protein